MTDTLDGPFVWNSVPPAPLTNAASLRRGWLPRRLWLRLRGFRWAEILVIDRAHFASATCEGLPPRVSFEMVVDESHFEHRWI